MEEDDDDADLDDITFTSNVNDFDRVWDAEEEEEDAEEVEEEIFDTFGGFNFAPRITEADTTNDRTSMDRKLDECLFLLVKQVSVSHHSA